MVVRDRLLTCLGYTPLPLNFHIDPHVDMEGRCKMRKKLVIVVLLAENVMLARQHYSIGIAAVNTRSLKALQTVAFKWHPLSMPAFSFLAQLGYLLSSVVCAATCDHCSDAPRPYSFYCITVYSWKDNKKNPSHSLTQTLSCIFVQVICDLLVIQCKGNCC